MAPREPAMSCVNHPASGGPTVRCALCLRPFCRACVRIDDVFFYCAACHPQRAVAGEATMGRPTPPAATPEPAPEPADSAPDLLTASLVRRGVALAIDALLVGFVVSVVLGIARNPDGPATVLIVFACSLLYEALFVQRTGQTIGKAMVGIEVTSATGAPASDGQAWLRALFKVSQLGCCGVWFLLAALSAERRGLHDHLAGTRVLRRPAGSVS
jgi:uncharacterized RDD family membrane protein YckC